MSTWITPAPAPTSDLGRWLTMAREREGRSYLGQVFDLLRMSRAPHRLEADEYYAHHLYRGDRDPTSFVGRRAIRHLLTEVVRSPWPALAVDQLAIRALLAGFDLPVPELLAVWSPNREPGAAQAWRTPAEASAGLAQLDGPLFLKPVDAANSGSVLSVDRVEGGRVHLPDGRAATLDDVVAQLAPRASGAGVQVQRRLSPHPDAQAVVGDRIATARMLWLVGESGPRLHRAVWRLPVGLSPCDALWRPGNLIAGVDLATGLVSGATRGLGPDRRSVDTHPDSGVALTSTPVPGWHDMVALTRRAAAAVAWCPIQAWDVAWTDRGAVLLELEGDGGDPLQLQLPYAAGLADAEWRALTVALEARALARDRAQPSWWATVRETWRRARED